RPTNGFDLEIVGLVGNARYAGVQREFPWALYVPYTQRNDYARKLLVHVQGPIAAVTTSIRKAIAEVDPNIPIQETTAVDDMVIRTFKNQQMLDRKSTRLNSSHDQISYAVFCLKK